MLGQVMDSVVEDARETVEVTVRTNEDLIVLQGVNLVGVWQIKLN